MEASAGAAAVDLDGVDILDPDLFADGAPHELLARMRDQAPVRWNATADGGGFWSVTRHEHVAAISRDTDTFSSSRAGIFLNPDQVVPLDLTRNLLLYKDPPEHTKYRKILQTAFVPNTVNKMEHDIRGRITRVIDEVVQAGHADFVKDVAVPVPLGVLAEMMGLPDEDMDRLYVWTEGIERAQLAKQGGAALDVFGEMAGYSTSRSRARSRRAASRWSPGCATPRWTASSSPTTRSWCSSPCWSSPATTPPATPPPQD